MFENRGFAEKWGKQKEVLGDWAQGAKDREGRGQERHRVENQQLNLNLTKLISV